MGLDQRERRNCFTIEKGDLKQSVEFADEEVFGAGEVVPDCQAQRQVGVLKRVGDVRNDVVFINADGKNLSFSVNSDDARAGLVSGRDEDRVSGDAVHVDAGARLQVVQVDVPVLGDQVNNVVLW